MKYLTIQTDRAAQARWILVEAGVFFQRTRRCAGEPSAADHARLSQRNFDWPLARYHSHCHGSAGRAEANLWLHIFRRRL